MRWSTLVEREKKFSDRDENCQQSESDLEGSLVTSSRPPLVRPQKRRDNRIWNGGVAVQAADGSRRTAGADDGILHGPTNFI